MGRVRQVTFCVALLMVSWLVMMLLHEVGHVLGALFTGGRVERVVVAPWTISRTDVEPNPYPNVVAWGGPAIGCLVPSVLWLLTGRRRRVGLIVQFFAGFCLVANGLYIGLGAVTAIGDAADMLRAGSPPWAMGLFGLVTTSLGLLLWHRLGSLTAFWNEPAIVTGRMTLWAVGTLVILGGALAGCSAWS